MRPQEPSDKAVFLDRDGVIVADRDYHYRLEDLELLEGSAQAIRELNDAGYLVIIVSNQSGVARGFFSEEDVQAFNRRMVAELEKAGARLDAIYYCPHHPSEAKLERYLKDCDCRKPKPGMLLKAAREHGLELTKSWMVGDKRSDVAAGEAAGCSTIFIGEEKGAADAAAKDLREAVRYILEKLRR